MDTPATITAHLDADTVALVERLALARGISSDAFAADAIQREAGFLAFAQEGIDDLDAGRTVPHDAVMAELRRMRDKYAARCPQ